MPNTVSSADGADILVELEDAEDSTLDEEVVDLVLDTEEKTKEKKPEPPKAEPTKSDVVVEDEKPDNTDEEDETYSERVQKRIRKLTKQRKEVEEALARERQKNEALLREKEESTSRSREAEKTAITQHEERLKAQRARAFQAIKAAREADNIDAEIAAQDELSRANAEYTALARYKYDLEREAGAPSRPEKKPPEKKEEVSLDPEPTIDRHTLNWYKRNDWFGKPEHRVMTHFTKTIAQELLEEGMRPDLDPDEFYNELDNRLRKEFPDKFKGQTAKRKPPSPVVGGRSTPTATRRSDGKLVVKLTKTQLAMANALGVSPQDYAKQLLEIERREGKV